MEHSEVLEHIVAKIEQTNNNSQTFPLNGEQFEAIIQKLHTRFGNYSVVVTKVTETSAQKVIDYIGIGNYLYMVEIIKSSKF